MLRNILLFAVVSANSCALFSGRQHTSSWALLDDVESVSCDPWPVGEKELDTENLMVLQTGHQVGFLAESKLRDGSKIFQYQPFNGTTDLTSSDTRNMSFGGGNVVLGGEFTEGGKSLAVVHNRGARDVTLKLHDIGTNVVNSESSSLAGRVQDGIVVASDSGYWLLLHRGPYQVAYLDGKPVKGVLPVQLFPKLSVSSRPALISNAEKNSIFMIDYDRKATRDGQIRGQLNLRRLMASGEVSRPTAIDFPVPTGIETWAATGKAGGFDLAMVSGDSMIGQASLKIAGVRVGSAAATVEWNKEISLKNMHLSQPVWVSAANGRWVLLLKWIDGESTLAAYKIGRAGVESTKHFGVFPKGTALVDAFYSGMASELIAIVRNKVGYRWNYEICNLGSGQ